MVLDSRGGNREGERVLPTCEEFEGEDCGLVQLESMVPAGEAGGEVGNLPVLEQKGL